MDCTPPSLDFAVIGHQDSWQNIAGFVNAIRHDEQEKLSVEKLKTIFPFIPPRDIFKVKVKSKTGDEINGVYIETFIDPEKLDPKFTRKNLGKVMEAINCSIKSGAGIVALGGFTSIILEADKQAPATPFTKFTTGNTLTAAYIVRAIEKAAVLQQLELRKANVLIIGATGDIGLACCNYFKNKVKKLLLNARNTDRLQKLAICLQNDVELSHSVSIQHLAPQADIIISVASCTGISLTDLQNDVLICDAGYPKI